VNTATGLLLYGGAGQSNYVAAKAGIIAFTEAIATEMAPYGVTANAIMPSAATRLATIGWRMAGAAATRATSARQDGAAHADATMSTGAAATRTGLDPTDPVHVAEFACYLASPEAGWMSGQTFQIRGSTIEHVGSWRVDHTVTRADQGWTAPELAGEMPRVFGAGAKRSDPPPAEWSEQYHADRPR
jgi:NAD(P)-dependent dehydrogenase (short-subunit alcohol dehydrogenase family)